MVVMMAKSEQSDAAMEISTAVEVINVSKKYRIWASSEARLKGPLLNYFSRLFPDGRLRRVLHSKATSYFRDFYALSKVSFTLQKGQAIGLLGRNGAGKSTLLQIIAGTLKPSSGAVRVNGKVSALLELGSGFNPNFTGRENVILNASIHGLTKKEIENKFDEIAEFAEIGDFMEQAVKTYSTGMMMRLAFAVQIAIDPDILIVDEALAVGDAPFQAKCYHRLRQMLDDGLTLLLVTHAPNVVRNFCSQALWLNKGEEMVVGDVAEVCDAYEKYCWKSSGIEMGGKDDSNALKRTHIDEETDSGGAVQNVADPERAERFVELANRERMGAGQVFIEDFYLENMQGAVVESIAYDEDIYAVYKIGVKEDVDCEFEIGLTVKDLQGTHAISVVDYEHNSRLTARAGDYAYAKMKTRLPLRAGRYYITTSLFGFPLGGKYKNQVVDFSSSTLFDRVEYACFINVKQRQGYPLWGMVHSDAVLTVQSSSTFTGE